MKLREVILELPDLKGVFGLALQLFLSGAESIPAIVKALLLLIARLLVSYKLYLLF